MMRNLTTCDYPGCANAGVHRAPKSRAAVRGHRQHYWWFCLCHVRSYNKNWNYYRGMSGAEIDADRYHDMYCRNAQSAAYITQPGIFENLSRRAARPTDPKTAAALRLFDLNETYTAATLRQRFCSVVKTLHPDVQTQRSCDDDLKLAVVYDAYKFLKDRLKDRLKDPFKNPPRRSTQKSAQQTAQRSN